MHTYATAGAAAGAAMGGLSDAGLGWSQRRTLNLNPRSGLGSGALNCPNQLAKAISFASSI